MRRLITLIIMYLLAAATAFSQSRVVTGKITDDNGVPVEGASVKIKGSKNGVAADANGNFSLAVPSNGILIITGIGLKTQEKIIGSQTNVNIIVARNSAELGNVIVTALGVRRQAKQLGYSTAKVSAEELNQAKVTNIATGLAAKVSGLSINLVNNGVKPDTRITLRGNRSILGNNQALLVVDDIQLPVAYINSISPGDVDNVTVLKGASASALYGSAASNGVIIITTKKGAKGKPQIRLSSSTTMESIAYTPKFQEEFGPWSGEYPDQYPGIISLDGRVKYTPGLPYNMNNLYAPYENQNYGGRYNGQKVPIGPPIRIYNPDGSFIIKQDSTIYAPVKNAKKGFFDKGVSYVNSMSYSSGDEKSRFYMSFEDVNTKGVIPNDVNHRNTLRLNGSRENGIFRADYNIGYGITHTNTTPGNNVPFYFGTSPITGAYNGGGNYYQKRPLYWDIINQPANVDLRKYRDWKNNPFASPDGFYNAYYGNPWWQIDQSRFDEHNNDLLGNLSITLKPTSWLALNYKVGFARNDYYNKYTKAGYIFAQWAIKDTLKASNIPSGLKLLSPSEAEGISYNQRLTGDFLASLHKTAGDFEGTLILGSSLLDNKINISAVGADALVLPNYYHIDNRIGNPVVKQYREQRRLVGVFGDLTIGYRNYLFIHSSIRNDWNSLLDQKNRSYLYPAVDASFVFTDAINGLKDNSILNYRKIRTAYSKTAQVSINPYSLQNVFLSGLNFPYGNTAGYTLDERFANQNIKPEFSTDEEIGLELSFLKSRIVFSSALYKTTTNNQTIPITISSGTGFKSAYVNSGQMLNKGVELDIKVTPLLTKNIRWEIGANYVYNKNILESIGYGLNSVPVTDPQVTTNSYAIVGQPYPVIRTNDWQRDPQGRIIINPKNGNPTLDPNLRTFGTSNPPTKIGLSTSFNYKGFMLSAVADGRFGAVIFNDLGSDLDFTGVSLYSTSSGRQPFVIPNSSYLDPLKNTYVENTKYNTQDGNNLFWANLWNTAGSNYVNSADFWKLREVSLSYTFSPTFLAHQKTIKGISIGVQGRNLLAFRAKDNLWTDPEFSNTTGNAFGTTNINQLPPTKFYGFNLTVNF